MALIFSFYVYYLKITILDYLILISDISIEQIYNNLFWKTILKNDSDFSSFKQNHFLSLRG